MEAKGLVKSKFTSEVYVKVTLMIKSLKTMKKKTSRKKDTVDPFFDEAFTFEVTADQLPDVEIISTVYETVSLQWGSSAIGQVIFGNLNKMTNAEKAQWSDVLSNQGHFVARWHSLFVVD